MAKKQHKRQRKTIRNKFLFYIRVMLILLIIIMSFVLYQSNKYYFSNSFYKKMGYNISNKLGLVLKNIYIEGQKNTDTKDILNALNIKHNESIFNKSVNNVKKDLEKISWVKSAVVYRQIPDSIYIGLNERDPIGVFKKDNQVFLFDNQGIKIKSHNVKLYHNLPVLVAEDIEIFTSNLFPIIKKDSNIYKQIIAIIRISERRWNIKFKNGLELKLPEHHVEEAWKNFVQLNSENDIFSKKIKVVDLRTYKKVFFEKKK